MKVITSLVTIVGTLMVSALMLVASMEEDIAMARIVTTQRRDVYQTIGLAGQILYADDRYIPAAVSGRIASVCVQENQRLASQDIIVQYQAGDKEQVAAAFISAAARLDVNDVNENAAMEAMIQQGVQRIDSDCTVRQVMVQAGTQITTGMPLIRVSSTEQEIRCMAAFVDAERIQPGMWAWIEQGGANQGTAVVNKIVKMKNDAGQIRYCICLTPEQTMDLEEGTAVQVDVYIAGSDDVVSLPIEAITDRDTVWWVDANGRCTEISAEIVLCDEMNAWVNLPEGIVIAVGEFREGQKIVVGAQ